MTFAGGVTVASLCFWIACRSVRLNQKRRGQVYVPGSESEEWSECNAAELPDVDGTADPRTTSGVF